MIESSYWWWRPLLSVAKFHINDDLSVTEFPMLFVGTFFFKNRKLIFQIQVDYSFRQTEFESWEAGLIQWVVHRRTEPWNKEPLWYARAAIWHPPQLILTILNSESFDFIGDVPGIVLDESPVFNHLDNFTSCRQHPLWTCLLLTSINSSSHTKMGTIYI